SNILTKLRSTLFTYTTLFRSENEELEKDSVDTDLDSLSRDDLEKVNVYNEGEYIELLYVIRGSSDTTNPVYKYDEDTSEYVRYNNGDFMADEIDGLEADYSEPEDDDN